MHKRVHLVDELAKSNVESKFVETLVLTKV